MAGELCTVSVSPGLLSLNSGALLREPWARQWCVSAGRLVTARRMGEPDGSAQEKWALQASPAGDGTTKDPGGGARRHVDRHARILWQVDVERHGVEGPWHLQSGASQGSNQRRAVMRRAVVMTRLESGGVQALAAVRAHRERPPT